MTATQTEGAERRDASAHPTTAPTHSQASSPKADFIAGIRTTLPLLIGMLPLAFILGAQGAQHGLSAVGMALMTSMNFAGGSEFAAVALWSAAPSFLVIFMTTWLVNCRHIVLGASLTPWMQQARLPLWKTLLAFFLMCDECWAFSMQEIERRRKLGRPAAELFSWHYHMGVGLTLWSSWFFTAALGAAAGGSLGDLTRWGFLMAFPATFIGLVAAMRPALPKCAPMVLSAIASAVASLWLPLHWSILIGTLAGLALAAIKD